DSITGDPGAGFFHFELRFRPGTLHKLCATPGPSQARLVDAGVDSAMSAWAMSDPVTQPDGTVSLYLLHKTADDKPFEMPTERTIRLRLTNMRADPGAGARSSRVEMRYSHLRVGTPTNSILTGVRITQFSIVS